MNFSMIFLLILLLASGLFQSVAHAQSISLAVDPPIFQIQAQPPANIISPLIIENRGDSPITLKVSFKPFIPSDQEDGLIKYVAESLPLDVRLIDSSGQTIEEFSLGPRQKKDLTLVILVPADAKANDYYFSIIFLMSGDPENSGNVSSSKSKAGIASNVLLSVGSEPAKGEVSEFSSPVFIEKGPVPFTVRIKNTSNHFIAPKGEILIKNIFGQTIGRVDLAQVNILANSVRNIPSEDYFDEGKSLPDNLSAYWPQNFILGPYKASLSIALSDTGPLFKRSIFFFAFPIKGTVIAIAGAFILIYIFAKVKSKV